MRIFIAGEHKTIEVIGMRKLINELGFSTELVQFEKAVGIFTPDLSEPETNCLKELIKEKIGKEVIIN